MIFETISSGFVGFIFGLAIVFIVGHAFLRLFGLVKDDNPMDNLIANLITGTLVIIGIVLILKFLYELDLIPHFFSLEFFAWAFFLFFIGVPLLFLLFDALVSVYVLLVNLCKFLIEQFLRLIKRKE